MSSNSGLQVKLHFFPNKFPLLQNVFPFSGVPGPGGQSISKQQCGGQQSSVGDVFASFTRFSSSKQFVWGTKFSNVLIRPSARVA